MDRGQTTKIQSRKAEAEPRLPFADELYSYVGRASIHSSDKATLLISAVES